MIFAIPAAAPAIPPKPRIAAMIAMTRKDSAQLNIRFFVGFDVHCGYI